MTNDALTSSAVLPIGPYLRIMSLEDAAVAPLLLQCGSGSLPRDLGAAAGPTFEPVWGEAPGRRYRVSLATDAGRATLQVVAVQDELLEMAAAPDTSPGLRALALHGALGATLDHLTGLGFGAAQLESIEVVGRAGAPRLAWTAVRVGGEVLGWFSVEQMDTGVLDVLLSARRDQGGSKAKGARSRRTRHLRVRGRLELGQRIVPLASLRSLRAGDVVILPGPSAQLEGAVATVEFGVRRGRTFRAEGRIQGDCFVTEGIIGMNDDEGGQHDEPVSDDTLSGLELPVSFEIDTVSLPISELETVAPGHVIKFALPATEARLRLVSCGQVIGQAELVSVAGRLGARITRMVAKDDADEQR